jgi:hypothetical protein
VVQAKTGGLFSATCTIAEDCKAEDCKLDILYGVRNEEMRGEGEKRYLPYKLAI